MSRMTKGGVVSTVGNITTTILTLDEIECLRLENCTYNNTLWNVPLNTNVISQTDKLRRLEIFNST